MGVSQIESSFQNDGNFSQLDLQNVLTRGPIMRIETFRCSQPDGEFGITRSGTSVKALAGKDHLSESSNRTFRHVFSAGPPDSVTALLEMREIFDEDGSFAVVVRDVDGRSKSFGYAMIGFTKPTDTSITVDYKLVAPRTTPSPKVINSPIEAPLTEQIDGLVDIADILDSNATHGEVTIELKPKGDNSSALSRLSEFSSKVQEEHPQWAENVQLFERMGDFRDKCIHDGTNLIGGNTKLASEFVMIRPYRKSLILSGRVFDPSMSQGANRTNLKNALAVDPKPGVYAVFLSAYAMNIGLYQLGIDKPHSDYGGVPMALKPGSRLETGAEPIVDATNLNRILALMSAIYYAPDALHSMVRTHPIITASGERRALPLFSHSGL